MIWAWIALFCIAAVVAIEQAFRRWVTPRIQGIFENVPPFNVAIEQPDENAERISITTSDGMTLRGCLINGDRGHSRGLVLFLPELRGNHWMVRRYCDSLIQAGYIILSFDFRNQGESDSMPGYVPIHWVTEYEMLDVASMLEYIESRPTLNSLPLLVCGVSRGGVAALLAACRHTRIRGVIADSAFGTMSMTKFFVDRFADHVIPKWLHRLLPTWHIELTLRDAMRMSERSRRCKYAHLERERDRMNSDSVLLISGQRDSYVTPEIARRLQGIVGGRCELWIAPGAKHNMSRSVCTEEYDRRVLEHAATCLQLRTESESNGEECDLERHLAHHYSIMQK